MAPIFGASCMKDNRFFMQQEQSFGNLGGVLDSDKIVICPSRENGKCFKYDPSGSWIHFATLRISRQHAGAVIVPGEFAVEFGHPKV